MKLKMAADQVLKRFSRQIRKEDAFIVRAATWKTRSSSSIWIWTPIAPALTGWPVISYGCGSALLRCCSSRDCAPWACRAPNWLMRPPARSGNDCSRLAPWLRSARAGFTFGSLRHFRFSTSSHRHIELWQGWYPKTVKFHHLANFTTPKLGRPGPPRGGACPQSTEFGGFHSATADGKVAPINFWSESGYELAL